MPNADKDWSSTYTTPCATIEGVKVFKLHTTAPRWNGFAVAGSLGYVALNADNTYTDVYDTAFAAAKAAR